MYKNNILTGIAAKTGIINGIDKIADAVKLTLGAKGKNAVIQEELYPGHIITNDGISIARKAFFEDPAEQIGANIIKEVADRTNKESGDGTTTSIVLTQAILKEGMKSGASGMEIKNSLDALVPFIEEEINKQKKEITVDEVEAVATISAESEKLGKTIAEIYKQIGKDGIIELDASKTFETTYEIKEGVRLKNVGMVSPYLANEGKNAVYKRPNILITKQKISTLQDIAPICEKLATNGKRELVIFTDDMDQAVAGTLIANHMTGQFKILILRAPTLWKDLVYEDFAKITGATIVEPASGIDFKNLELSHLGSCEKIIADKDETTILGIQDITNHIAELKEKADEQSLLRVSWLTTKAAVLKLGANSESELSYIRLKAEDAVNAARLALEDGIVPGGGITLLNIAKQLRSKNTHLEVEVSADEKGKVNFDEKVYKIDNIGAQILGKALIAPFLQICENANAKVDFIVESFEDISLNGIFLNKESFGGSVGYDAKNNRIVDMWKENIVDPAKVTKNAVKNAISIAGTVLTSEIVITLPPKSQEEIAREMMMSMPRPY